jgi:UDP-N-acetylmuramate dehydrogenase
MDERQKTGLLGIGGDSVRFNCPMDQYTTFRIGGKVDALCITRELRGLQQVVSYLNKENVPYLVVGRGSNLLVKDEGFKGVVIIMRGELATIEQHERNDQIVLAGGGLGLGDLVRHCSHKGLGGLEFLAGIPGTVGGAVAMNAGAFGKDTGSVVQEIQVVTRQGELAIKNRSELAFSYRELSIPEGTVVVRASFQCTQETPEIVSSRVADSLTRRKATQPLEYPSAGSVFKNPPNDYAGRLIEKAGLKGKRVGGAMISPKHANYIVNTGGARAEDVLALMNLAREKVREDTGIELEPEIKVVGT